MEKKEKQERAEDFSQGEGLKPAEREVTDLSPLPVINFTLFLFSAAFQLFWDISNVLGTFRIMPEDTFLCVSRKKVYMTSV